MRRLPRPVCGGSDTLLSSISTHRRRRFKARRSSAFAIEIWRKRIALPNFWVPTTRSTTLAPRVRAVSPDFVDIITPADSHLNLVAACAEQGVAIICPKPSRQILKPRNESSNGPCRRRWA